MDWYFWVKNRDEFRYVWTLLQAVCPWWRKGGGASRDNYTSCIRPHHSHQMSTLVASPLASLCTDSRVLLVTSGSLEDPPSADIWWLVIEALTVVEWVRKSGDFDSNSEHCFMFPFAQCKSTRNENPETSLNRWTILKHPIQSSAPPLP